MVPPGMDACGPSRQAFGLPQADAGETRARWRSRSSAPNAPDSLSPTASREHLAVALLGHPADPAGLVLADASVNAQRPHQVVGLRVETRGRTPP